MMSRLLEAHQLRSEEMHRQQLGRQQEELKRTIETTIAQHCQSLSSAIVQERTERTQAISEVQAQITELRNAFETFSTNSIPPSRAGGNRIDEIMIGGFELKSKHRGNCIGGEDYRRKKWRSSNHHGPSGLYADGYSN